MGVYDTLWGKCCRRKVKKIIPLRSIIKSYIVHIEIYHICQPGSVGSLGRRFSWDEFFPEEVDHLDENQHYDDPFEEVAHPMLIHFAEYCKVVFYVLEIRLDFLVAGAQVEYANHSRIDFVKILVLPYYVRRDCHIFCVNSR